MTHFERDLKHAEKKQKHLLMEAERAYQRTLGECERFVNNAERALQEAEEGAYKTFASCGAVHLSERRVKTPKGKAYFKKGQVYAEVIVERTSHQEARTKTHTTPIPFWIPGTTIVGGVVRQKKETTVVNVPETHSYLVIKAPRFTHVSESGWRKGSFAEKVNETSKNWRKIKKERAAKIKQAKIELEEARQAAPQNAKLAEVELEKAKSLASMQYEQEHKAAVQRYREEGHPSLPPDKWK